MTGFPQMAEEAMVSRTPEEFFSRSRSVLHRKSLFEIYGVGNSQVGRWCLPKHHPDAAPNPLERLRMHFEAMVQAGEEDEVRAMLAYLGRPLEQGQASSEHPTIERSGLTYISQATLAAELAADPDNHPNVVEAQVKKVGDIGRQLVETHRRAYVKASGDMRFSRTPGPTFLMTVFDQFLPKKGKASVESKG